MPDNMHVKNHVIYPTTQMLTYGLKTKKKKKKKKKKKDHQNGDFQRLCTVRESIVESDLRLCTVFHKVATFGDFNDLFWRLYESNTWQVASAATLVLWSYSVEFSPII